MVDIPNTTNRSNVLKSQGDGSNASFWAPGLYVFPQVTVNQQAVSNSGTYTLVSGYSVSVSGYRSYLCLASSTVTNNDTGGAHLLYLQFGLDGTLSGGINFTSLDAKSSGQYYQNVSNSLVITTTDTNTHTIGVYGVIPGATNNGTLYVGNLVVIGLY